MIHHGLYKFILLWTLSLSSFMTHAQQVYTIEEAIRTAIDNNLLMLSGELVTKQAEMGYEAAQLARWPNLNGNIGLSSNFGRTIDPTTNDFINRTFISNNFGLSSGVLLYNAGRINHTIEQAQLAVEQAKLNNEATEFDIALQVANAYLGVVFAEENIRLVENQLVSVQTQLENIKKLIRAGARAENDSFDLEAQVAQRQQTVLEARNNLALSKMQLAQLMMVEPETIITDKTLPVAITLDPNEVDRATLEEAVIKLHPAYQAAEVSIASARIGEKIAEAGYYPSLTLGGNLGTAYSNSGVEVAGFTTQTISQDVIFNGNPVTIDFLQDVPILEDSPYFSQLGNNVSLGLGLGLNVPIFNNGQTNLAVERARLNTINQEISLNQVEQQLAISLQQILLDARTAKANYEAANIALEAQKKAFDNTDRRYQLGAAGNFEWITAQNLLQQSELNTTLTRFQYYFSVTLLDFYLNGLPINR